MTREEFIEQWVAVEWRDEATRQLDALLEATRKAVPLCGKCNQPMSRLTADGETSACFECFRCCDVEAPAATKPEAKCERCGGTGGPVPLMPGFVDAQCPACNGSGSANAGEAGE